MLACLSVILVSIAHVAYAAFGYTQSSTGYTIDAGSSNPLTFFVNSASCDITSMNFYATELQSSTASHIGSGLGTATVTVSKTDDYIKVTCATSTLTQYFVVKNGESNIYMATYITAEPSVGELRYIARLKGDVLPNEEPFGVVSNTAGSTSAVEGTDVYVVGSETRSKFYSSQRFIDDLRHCVASSSLRVCFIMPGNAYESSSGGPFFRDINSNNVGDQTHLTFYMNSGHVQTEAYRTGLFGPYVLTFTRSGTPSTSIDTSFFSTLGISGYVATASRGYVKGTASGTSSSLETVVHWYNSAAQYWVKASGGSFTSPAMKPGTYTMVLYQQELKVASQSVTVSAGSTTTSNIAGSFTTGTTLFRIGTWDGTPAGLLNAANQLRMHPSDSRMSSWGPVTFTVGSSADSAFPMALFESVNNPVTIKFTLTAAQASGAATLRIGTTLSFAGGRPQATINSYSGAAPAAPTKIDSRGVTRGAYRGLGEIYNVAIPAGTLVTGTNTITINVISGSSGTTFLSPNFIFDAVELFR